MIMIPARYFNRTPVIFLFLNFEERDYDLKLVNGYVINQFDQGFYFMLNLFNSGLKIINLVSLVINKIGNHIYYSSLLLEAD